MLRVVRNGWLHNAVMGVQDILSTAPFQTHFDENPRDLQVLRHDDVLQPLRVQPHLKYIPPYLGRRPPPPLGAKMRA